MHDYPPGTDAGAITCSQSTAIQWPGNAVVEISMKFGASRQILYRPISLDGEGDRKAAS